MASLSNTNIVKKSEKLATFLSILFSKTKYDKSEDLNSLVPAEISGETFELIQSSLSTLDQSIPFSDGIKVLLVTFPN